MNRPLRIQYPDAYYHAGGNNGEKSSAIPKTGRTSFACRPDRVARSRDGNRKIGFKNRLLIAVA
jgi:hypothetical protein